jgi:hypothetical protein
MSTIANFDDFAARLRQFIGASARGGQAPASLHTEFDRLALDLFALQFEHNALYGRVCKARGITPQSVEHWSRVPAMPTSAFKEMELSCLPPAERRAVFYSSGTTQGLSSRHFHNHVSLALYEASLLPWFETHLLGHRVSRGTTIPNAAAGFIRMLALTPKAAAAPHSSLVHMFEVVAREFGLANSAFVGTVSADGSWDLDVGAAITVLEDACVAGEPLAILGTAFSFVHLLDALAERKMHLELPRGSRALETGGYKGRSRALPKAELHALITRKLGIPSRHIVCEYGMSELSSQAYDRVVGAPQPSTSSTLPTLHAPRHVEAERRRPRSAFLFPPWVRVQMISAETGREVAEGGSGLIRVFDLANVYSVMAIQTEDLGIRHGAGFELLGRAALAEPRGCSLMAT